MDYQELEPGTYVVTVDDFEGNDAPHVLSFKKGEKFQIVVRLDKNWYYGKNNIGTKGYLPRKLLRNLSEASIAQERLVDIQVLPWLHGKISRDESNKLLANHSRGSFLVRESTNSVGNWVLSVQNETEIENYIVKKNKEGKLDIEEGRFRFADLSDLIEFYRLEKPTALCCQLTLYIPRKTITDEEIEAFRNKGWVLDFERLHIGEKVGKGEFSDVSKGHYGREAVAVKIFKDTPSTAQDFLSEASIMTRLSHPNIVPMVGIIFSGSDLYLLSKLMEGGNLEVFLRSRGKREIPNDLKLKFASEVCSGMKYLESKRIVHRDLATRNILLSKEMDIKISDFGLASFENLYAEGKVPIKWTAPEAFIRKRFNSNSDMWSFGVLLWEIYSYGKIPFSKIQVDQVMDKLKTGYRLKRPEDCPQDMYDLMLRYCWHKDPAQRSSFSKMQELLEKHKQHV